MLHLTLLVAGLSALADSPRPQRKQVPVATRALPDGPVHAVRIEHLRREIAADNLDRRAWAVLEASERHVRELAPDVLTALRRAVQEPREEPNRWFFQRLLDAAIRLDVRVPASDLMATWKAYPFEPQLIALAARAPGEHVEFLVALRSTGSQDARVAADNLLAAGAPRRAVDLLLPDARMEISVRVHTTECRIGVSRDRPYILRCYASGLPTPVPPVAEYECVDARVPGAIAVVDGPRPISILRHESSRSLRGCRRVAPRDREAHALDLLRWIAGDEDRISTLTSIVDLDHTWTSEADYLAFVEAERRPCVTAWTKLVDALVARGALAPEKRPAEAPIEVVVEDLRSDTSVPLPELRR